MYDFNIHLAISSTFISPFLISKMMNIGMSVALPKLEYYLSSNKQDKNIPFFGFLYKQRSRHNASVHPVCHESVL